jgi:hypothetical protein
MWGYNYFGQLGDCTTIKKTTPTKITVPTTTVSSLTSLLVPVYLTSTVSADTDTDTDTQIKTFTDLNPNEIYNLYALKSGESENPLGAENLLYITQTTADENGKIALNYGFTEDYDDALWLAVPLAQTDISTADVTVENLTYTGEEQFVEPTVSLGGKTLTEGEDYCLENAYSATAVGEYTVTVRGTGLYKGTVDVTYSVICKHNYTAKITTAATCTATGVKTYTCEICGDTYTETVKATGHTAVTDKAVAATCTAAGKTAGSHCSVCGEVITAQKTVKAKGHTYDSGKITKAATCTATGVKTYTCTVCKSTKTETISKTGHKYTVTKTVKPTVKAQGYTLKTCSVCGTKIKTNYTAKLIAMSKCKVTGVKSTYAYTGKSLAPTVTVKYGKIKLTKGTDYTVSYKNNKKTGKATITIKGKGKYSGTITKTFVIVPKKAVVSSVKSAKTKTVTVKWKKDSQSTGYELLYSTSSKFKSAKKLTVKKNSTVTKTLSSLKKGKTYYVKVRSYKTISGKKYYGAYSAVKKVKCG